MGRKKTDYSGKIINDIRLEKRIEDYIAPGGTSRPLARYNCTCMRCNRNYDSLLAQITKRTYPGCGCMAAQEAHKPRPNRIRDISGQRFTHCLAIKRMQNGKWECLCDCGNYFQTSLSHLTTGHTTSCGCYRIENTRNMRFLDITGRTYNELTAIKFMYSQKSPNGTSSSMWLCKCSCGTNTIVSLNELRTGGTKSCGHVKASYRENQIRKYLNLQKINYLTEYKFADLKLKRCLRFDFALFDKQKNLVCLIEHQGRQHFEEYSKTTKMGELQREVTDAMKVEYCQKHGIKLHIIRFDDDLEQSLNTILANYMLIPCQAYSLIS